MSAEVDAIIIGGGLSGLTCANVLHNAGVSCQVLEAGDQVGGRVRTDHVDGFLLDRGFQVFLTAYPEAQQILDYEALGFHRFQPGALVRFQDRFHRFVDPWRQPRYLLATALSPVATLADKFRVANFRRFATQSALTEIYQRPETKTIELLRQRGFSAAIVERFFRPFLGGIMLDRDLETSSRMCEFVFRMFSAGDTVLPARGMGEIPRQLAKRLPDEMVKLNSSVQSIDDRSVVLATGERRTARAIVVATAAPAARKLLDHPPVIAGRCVTNIYFAAPEPPLRGPTLVLNGTGEGVVNNLCVPSEVAPGYAPAGQSLVSVTVVESNQDEESLVRQVQAELESWFGAIVKSWHHLRTYVIPYALPVQAPPALEPVAKPNQVGEGVFICGDYCDTASINGAMASGRRAAEAVVAALEKQ